MAQPGVNFVPPGVLPVAPPALGAKAATELATAANVTGMLYSGNAREIYQRWNSDRREAMLNPAQFLSRHARIAAEEDYKAADIAISRMTKEQLAAAGPSIRDLYADLNARSRGAFAGFREITIKAGLTNHSYSQEQQDEATVRFMGQVMMADIWDKTTGLDKTLDFLASAVTADPNASFFGLIDPETPPEFDSRLIDRINRLPPYQRIIALATWQDKLIDVHGNFLDLSMEGIGGDLLHGTGTQASRESRTNILHVLSNMSSFFDGTTPETNKLIGMLNNMLVGVDAVQGIRAAVKLTARGGRFSAGVLDSARRAGDRRARTRTPLTPDKPKVQSAAETPAGDASRTAQEAQQGASGEGAASTLQGTETAPRTGAPTASAVAAGDNPEVSLDAPAGPFTKDDYSNFGTGGVVAQNARDAAAAAAGEVAQGARITRRGLQRAAVTEADNALAGASRDARTPRVGEPVISSESPQLELPLVRTTRIEPTVSGPADDYPGSGWDTVRDHQLGNPSEGPVAPMRPGEPFISEVSDVKSLPDENEIITGQLGALTLKVPAVAEATGTDLAQVVAHLIPGGEELYPVSPEVGRVISEAVHSQSNKELFDLKEALFNAIRGTYAGEQLTLATTKEVRNALRAAGIDLKRKIKREIAARQEVANVSVKRTAMRQIGDHTYEVTYKVYDKTGDPTLPIAEETRVVVIGADDIRTAGDLPASVLRTGDGPASPKHLLMFNPGRTVDFLVENAEIALHRTDQYKQIFDSAIKTVFSGISKGSAKKVRAAIARSVQMGDGKYLRASIPDLTLGEFRLDNGQVLVLSPQEAQAYQRFMDLVEVNAYALNAMRTEELRAKKVKVFRHPEHGDIYAREVGEGFVAKVETGDPTKRPAILNHASAPRKDGTVKKTLSWQEFKDNFWKEEGHPYVLVNLEYKLQTSPNEAYSLMLVDSNDIGNIPDGVPWNPLTWIPDVPNNSRYAVTRTTFGTVNGIENQPIKTRVIARAATKEAADLYASNVTRFGNEEIKTVPDNISRWKGDVTYNPVDVVDDEIVDVQNLDIVQNMDPVSAVSRSLGIIAKDLPIQAFRRLQKARWVKAAEKAGVIADGSTFENIRLVDSDLGKQFERVRDYTKKVIGAKTEPERLWSKALNHLAERLVGLAPDGVARTVFNLADPDPIGWAQSVTMHTQLGFGNPSQLFTQASNVGTAAAVLNPVVAVQAAPLGALFMMRTHAGIMADPLVEAARIEHLARMMRSMGFFDNLREARLLIQKFDNSGLLANMQNTGDLAEVADVSSLHALQGMKELSLLPYSIGVRTERTYTYALSFMNYRNVLAKRGDTRKITEWTHADWNNVFADQQNLTLNMSSANRAGYQENWFLRLPTQFWQVMSKFLEASLGKSRMITGEADRSFSGTRRAAKLLAFQGTMYGMAGLGVSSAAYMIYQTVHGSTPEEDIKNGKSAAEVEKEMVWYRGGMITAGVYGLTGGTEFSIANRMSILNGFSETMEGLFTGDKPLNETMLGATNTWLKEVTSLDFLYPARMLLQDPSESGMQNFRTSLDIVDMIGTANSAKSALDMYYDHKYQTRSGNVVEYRDYNTAEVIMTGLGFRMQAAMDLPRVAMDKREIDTDLTNRAKRIAAMMNVMATDPKYREPGGELLFQAKLEEVLGGLPPDLRMEVGKKMLKPLLEQDSQYSQFVLDNLNPEVYNTTAMRNMRIKAAVDAEKGDLNAQP